MPRLFIIEQAGACQNSQQGFDEKISIKLCIKGSNMLYHDIKLRINSKIAFLTRLPGDDVDEWNKTRFRILVT